MTEKSFREKWLEAVDRKGSVLCAGLDPAEFKMGRGDEGLPASDIPFNWALKYIEAAAPFCAAVKPNINYWKRRDGMQDLYDIANLAHSLGLVVIEDSKLADIGSTNDAGMYYARQKGMDAVTFSPFAGNLEEAVKQAHSRDLGLISMVLMSNPEFGKIKSMWVDVEDDFEAYNGRAGIICGSHHVEYYLKLARDAQRFGADGIVIGAPSPKNHIKEYEIQAVRKLVDDNMLVLLPGVGKQGGEAGIIWKYFGRNNVIVNVGRDLMFPNGSNSTPEQQAEKAKYYFDMLNQLRAA